jgi:four helix bundle protein
MFVDVLILNDNKYFTGWQEARELCKVVYEITSKGPFSTDYKFRDQMRASSGSAMDNIACPVK